MIPSSCAYVTVNVANLAWLFTLAGLTTIRVGKEAVFARSTLQLGAQTFL